MIKARFAPSPTGYLHIGGARTALFNFMYVKAQKGTFVLRIEDTDQVRSKKEYEEEILASMKWLGMDFDEIFYQSKRFDLYQGYAQKLVDQGKAYKQDNAILFKMESCELKLYDLIRGEINFDTSNFTARNEDGSTVVDAAGSPVLKDEVLIKNDGSPAYSFACVIDDATMEITHVIRGEDHISNTPKQMMMYEALGFKPPKFAHLPLIMGEDGGRLSKRTGAVAVSDYKAQGFLPEALVNYLLLLGWSPGNNQEIISLDSAISKFSIKKINKAAAVFSMDKLRWVNAQYTKTMDAQKLVDFLVPFLKEKEYINDTFDQSKLVKVVNLYKGRFADINEFLERTDFIFIEDIVIDEEMRAKHLLDNQKSAFKLLSDRLSILDNFDTLSAEKTFREVVSELSLEASGLVHPVRVALTGKDIGPGLFETMDILGKDKTVKRLLKVFK
ncbi:MAG: glutamate--tRNA ligase [Candidatus Zapsychrus exili]|nr:glutamate--tRNA ligase [Candidatus Zapsychrus exili]